MPFSFCRILEVSMASGNKQLTPPQLYYIILTLHIHFDEIRRAQGGTWPISTTNGRGWNHTYADRVDDILRFMGKFSVNNKSVSNELREQLAHTCLHKVETRHWELSEIVGSFEEFGIYTEVFNIEKPFGALVTPKDWLDYITTYLIPTRLDNPVIHGHSLGMSPWLNCFYILGMDRRYE